MKKSFVAMTAGAIVLSASLLSMPAMAGGGKGKTRMDPAEAFKKLDTNNDGKLSKEEFSKFEHARKKGGETKKPANLFNRLDTNHDGFLSPEEFQKLYEHRTKK